MINKHATRLWQIVVFCASLSMVLVVLSGCGSTRQKSSRSIRTFDPGGARKIAVLPFENFSNVEFAGEKMRRALISALVIKGYNVIEPGEVTRTLRTVKVRRLDLISVDAIREIGKVLNVETIVMGSVGKYGIGRGVSVTYPEIAMNLFVINTVSGSIERSLWHTRGGAGFWTRHFGIEGKTLSEVERQVAKDAVEKLF